ncbi:hypothetical protein CANARDRAFT_26515 [[Candida] arabinofermentans NRRL YB-2248]|uniref:Ketoreductase (KR) domain-containing protein n=1 Tax=[Candida] arabinofermentans NRRL YB-2248 TaxID=983967 RepID=A0A1E4T5S9_9ASCO|nr:hypothetical protein CANARDRAFT_26515 [[Candida] arabinofermentans NRRL YB-2248]
MPLNILGTILLDGTDAVPGWQYIKKYAPPLIGLGLTKFYFSGTSNTWERDLHGKVYIVTGGTSGIGASLCYDLASKGAQLVILTSQLDEDDSSGGSLWISDFIQDLRDKTDNFMIYAESCDLSSLYSIRKFATKWLDNSPPRRLDGIICCAAESLPIGKKREASIDGVERQIAINYLGHYHLLTLLEPALKVQLADRDVRIILTTCLSQSMGQLDLNDLIWENRKFPSNSPWKVYGTSKLMLNMFGKEYQKRLDKFERKDGMLNNVRINMVNPGIVRTPSTRRVISMGSILGLIIYLLLYPIFWLFLKSTEGGMQSILYGLTSPEFMQIKGGNYIKECSILEKESRSELKNDELQSELFDKTKELIEELEKRSAIERNKLKKNNKTKQKKEDVSKITELNETNENLQKDKLSIFSSAFKQTQDPIIELPKEPLYPDLSKLTDDKAKNLRLRSLDEKFEKARKRKV